MAARPNNSVRRTVTLIAATVGLLTALTIPAIQGYTAYYNEYRHMQLLARQLAQEVSFFVFTNSDLWRVQSYRIEERISRYLARNEATHWVRLTDNTGEIIVQIGRDPTIPSISTTVTVNDGNKRVGRLQVVENVLHIWINIGFAAVLGLALGVVGFIALRVLPLRALSRALSERDAEFDRRRRMEETLRDSEAQFRDLTEGSIQGIAIYRNFKALYVNQAYADIFGYDSPEEILALDSLLVLFAPREHARISQFRQARLAGENVPAEYEHEGLRKDGSSIHLENRVRIVLWEGERATQATVFDITERKRAEQALRTRERSLANAQRIAHLGSWRWNRKSGEIWWSEETYRIFGLEPDTDKPSPEMFLEMVRAEDRRLIKTAFVNVLRRRVPFAALDHRIVRPSGEERWAHSEIHASFESEVNPTHLRGTIHDITERKTAEDQLRQAQKIEAIGQLTGGVAHDFNNLLTVVLGNLELLEENLEDDEGLSKRVRAALRAALRGAELTRRLLAFSRSQSLEPVVVKLNDLISGMADMLRRTLGETVELKTVLFPDLWAFRADAAQLENAILNLAVNARDAMPGGGTLTIATANADLDKADASRHDGLEAGPYVMVSVSDNGIGMLPKVLEHVFEPFFTTKEIGQGTGLGLSMVYGFVNQSGGYIDIDSEEGRGTTVRLYFQRAEAGVAATEDVASEDALVNGKGTILVVEDDPAVREVTETILEQLGYRVLVAEDGSAALAILADNPEVDLVFTDVVMPHGMSGFDLAEQVKARFGDKKVLFTSGYAAAIIRREGNIPEGVHWISKPYSRQKLAREIHQALDG